MGWVLVIVLHGSDPGEDKSMTAGFDSLFYHSHLHERYLSGLHFLTCRCNLRVMEVLRPEDYQGVSEFHVPFTLNVFNEVWMCYLVFERWL